MGRHFWKVCAATAVLLAAAYVTWPLWAPAGSAAAPYAEAGGGIGSVISFAGLDERDGKIYVVDSQAKVVLIYAASQGANSFNLVAGRAFASDGVAVRNLATRGLDLRYNIRGYSVADTENAARGG